MCTSARSMETIHVPCAAVGNTRRQTAPQHQPAAIAMWKVNSTCSARCGDASAACHEPTSLSVDCPHGPAKCDICHGPHPFAVCPSMVCFQCNQPGNTPWTCDQPAICSRCGGTGHYSCESMVDYWTCFDAVSAVMSSGCAPPLDQRLRRKHYRRQCQLPHRLHTRPCLAPLPMSSLPSSAAEFAHGLVCLRADDETGAVFQFVVLSQTRQCMSLHGMAARRPLVPASCSESDSDSDSDSHCPASISRGCMRACRNGYYEGGW